MYSILRFSEEFKKYSSAKLHALQISSSGGLLTKIIPENRVLIVSDTLLKPRPYKLRTVYYPVNDVYHEFHLPSELLFKYVDPDKPEWRQNKLVNRGTIERYLGGAKLTKREMENMTKYLHDYIVHVATKIMLEKNTNKYTNEIKELTVLRNLNYWLEKEIEYAIYEDTLIIDKATLILYQLGHDPY